MSRSSMGRYLGLGWLAAWDPLFTCTVLGGLLLSEPINFLLGRAHLWIPASYVWCRCRRLSPPRLYSTCPYMNRHIPKFYPGTGVEANHVDKFSSVCWTIFTLLPNLSLVEILFGTRGLFNINLFEIPGEDPVRLYLEILIFFRSLIRPIWISRCHSMSFLSIYQYTLNVLNALNVLNTACTPM